MEAQLEKQIYTKLNKLENEIEGLKLLVGAKESTKQKKLVSLKGMAKLLVSEKELDKAIEEAQKSLTKGADNALRG